MRTRTVWFCALLLAAFGFAGACDADERIRLIFIGDIMAHEQQLETAKSGDVYDFSPQFRRIVPLLERALVVGNLETAFAGEEAGGFTGYPEFNTPDVLAETLVATKIDIVTLANNHILDRREAGAARTASVLDRAGLRWTGIATTESGLNEPLVVEHKGLRIAFLNYTYGNNNPPSSDRASAAAFVNVISEDAVLSGLSKARAARADLIVVCMHWGNEYVYAPTARDKAIADLCLQNGANLVIGTHPHVLQPMEIRNPQTEPQLVAWSLGNFVSFQRTLPRERSVVLAVDLQRIARVTRIARVSVAPTWVSVARYWGKRRIEVVYAGAGKRFNHEGLHAEELQKARTAGAHALQYLGVKGEPDDEGFYTLWSATSPDVLPVPGRRSPE